MAFTCRRDNTIEREVIIIDHHSTNDQPFNLIGTNRLGRLADLQIRASLESRNDQELIKTKFLFNTLSSSIARCYLRDLLNAI